MANDNWINIRLGDVCSKIGSGATPRGGASVYLEAGKIVLIRSQNVYNEGFHREGLAFISEEHAEQLSNVEVQPDDVLLNITGDSVARCCQVDPAVLPARVNQHVSIIRPDPRHLDARFLRYFMVSLQMQGMMLSWAGAGGTRKALTKGMIESFQVFSPKDITEQQAIACILGTLDNKIEWNRRMNQTLEGMARAIFKSWFVDFDPVRAKAVGQQPPGLASHIADLFPDAFEASELGEIPKGWKIRPIGDAVKAVGGGTPSTKNPAYWGEGVHCFATPKDLSGLSSPMLLDTGRRVTDAGLAKISSGLLPVGTVLLSSRAPVGYLAITQIPVCVNQGFIAMICNDPVSNYYVLNWAKVNMPEIKRHASGTTFAEISKRNFRPIPALVPSQEVMTAFDTIVEPVYGKIWLNLEESHTLTTLRDTLLPKLISGELRVPDAKRFCVEVGL